MLSADPYDLVAVDPAISSGGFVLLKHVKDHYRWTATLLATHNQDPQFLRQAVKCRIDGLLFRPASSTEFVEQALLLAACAPNSKSSARDCPDSPDGTPFSRTAYSQAASAQSSAQGDWLLKAGIKRRQSQNLTLWRFGESGVPPPTSRGLTRFHGQKTGPSVDSKLPWLVRSAFSRVQENARLSSSTSASVSRRDRADAFSRT
jgi:hypothetical protein